MLTFVPSTLEATHALIARMNSAQRAELSPAWLARVDSGTADSWTLGFTMVLQAGGASIGSCGFKGPATSDGTVEIAYGITPEHEGKGYATDAAMWLADYAFNSGRVHLVRAHTVSKDGASARVLVKCGFLCVGQVNEPDEGAVWRWERSKSEGTVALDTI
ncbi:hypothetical protein BH11GEM2_BH11GEM2_30430 [soil metagenome]